MKRMLVVAMAGLLTMAGCSSKDDKVAKQIVGQWTMETPKSDKAGPFSAMKVPLEFKADGTLVMRIGPMEQGKPWQVKDGKLIIDNRDPQTIHELTANRLVFGDGPQKKVLTR
jgi:hypothetical protein